MKHRLFLLTLLALTASLSFAARARGGWRTYTQPDGSTIMAELRGDEWFHYYATLDGVPLVLDAESQTLCYADVFGFGMKSSGVMAHEASLRTAAERQHVASLSDVGRVEPYMRARQAPLRALNSLNTEWDSLKVYRSPVLLIQFPDWSFGIDNPKAVYDSIFNSPGYNQMDGPGCVADYFREQSGGLLNMHFDVVGPITVSKNVKGNDHGLTLFLEAAMAAADSLDFTQYDWYDNGRVQQVVYVYAGYGGNDASGYIWPSTGSLSSISIDGKKLQTYTASPERWYRNNASTYTSCGIGTICHEFSHCLGLPDMYPAGSSVTETAFSIVDEWDLMDGGNYTNWGWCPCNYSAHEKELLGWYTPVVLTDTASIRHLKPLSQGGQAYKVVNDRYPSEYYLLENRQQQGWDADAPGHGLLITHVDYSSTVWNNNSVNAKRGLHRMHLLHADNLDYEAWDNIVGANNSPYLYSQKRNSRLLSTSPYPYVADSAAAVVVCELTDSSVPAAKTNNLNSAGQYLMSKPITGIVEHDDGTVSFDFLGGTLTPASLGSPTTGGAGQQPSAAAVFDLRGRRLPAMGRKGLYVVRQANGAVRKIAR